MRVSVVAVGAGFTDCAGNQCANNNSVRPIFVFSNFNLKFRVQPLGCRLREEQPKGWTLNLRAATLPLFLPQVCH